MKLRQLINSLITVIIGTAMTSFGFYCNTALADTLGPNGSGLSKLLYIPMLVILYILAFGQSVSAIVNSSIAISSQSKAIKIMSICLLIIAVALLGFFIYCAVQFFSIAEFKF